jgi:hypothetical protein
MGLVAKSSQSASPHPLAGGRHAGESERERAPASGGERRKGIACCARAARGHATAPPMSVMTSRRPMQNVI